jgi:hypothetical protein
MSKSSRKREIQYKKLQKAAKQGAKTQFKQAPQANNEKLRKR